MVYTVRQGGDPMPWKVINQMDLKIQFINDWNKGYSTKTDLSQKYGVSRPTIYKRTFYITELLTGQPVGLKEIGDGLWQLQFALWR